MVWTEYIYFGALPVEVYGFREPTDITRSAASLLLSLDAGIEKRVLSIMFFLTFK